MRTFVHVCASSGVVRYKCGPLRSEGSGAQTGYIWLSLAVQVDAVAEAAAQEGPAGVPRQPVPYGCASVNAHQKRPRDVECQSFVDLAKRLFSMGRTIVSSAAFALMAA
eukprot:5203644-Pyramimonas_sp.AAC.1